MRVVVVTGSSRGIGLALAEACIARGDRVVLHGRDLAQLAPLAARLGPNATAVAADLATVAGAESLVAAALAAVGRIDVLVNNAAITAARAPLWELDPSELAAVIATNVVGPLACARAVLAWAIPRDEPVRIVNVSSGIHARPRADAAPYAASKAALDAMTLALARDLDRARARATITAVALPATRTDLSRRALPDDEFDRLPDTTAAAVHRLLHALAAPPEAVHGRVLATAITAAPTARAPATDGADAIPHPLGPSPRARDALAAVARDAALDRYPDRAPLALRKILAARHGCALDAIVLGAGASELVSRILRTTLRPGETLVASAPAWPGLADACRAHGLAWRQIPSLLTPTRVADDLAAIAAAAAVDRAVRLVYLVSPGNPGGAAIDRAAFDAFLARLPRHVTLVVDEAYAEFIDRPPTSPPALDAARMVRHADRPLVVVRTFSKFYALAGLRVGYAIATPDLAAPLAAAAPAFPFARGAAEAALAALADTSHAAATRAAIAAGRARLAAELAARGFHALASDAPFVLAAVPGSIEIPDAGPRYFDRAYVMLPVGKEVPWPAK